MVSIVYGPFGETSTPTQSKVNLIAVEEGSSFSSLSMVFMFMPKGIHSA